MALSHSVFVYLSDGLISENQKNNMKLAAIYNLWDGIELLEGSLKTIMEHVDVFIFVYQKKSNFGEDYDPEKEIMAATKILLQRSKGGFIHSYFIFDPTIWEGSTNEKKKRNIGLDIARENECTHFFHIDCDEYFEDFSALKKEYEASGHAGSVCPIYTYFKHPTWRLENLDGYFVPFIHELHEDTKAGMSSYPFYCDPTRVINCSSVVKLSQPMHHFSWVRKDIQRKARNSSAKAFGNKLQGLLQDHSILQNDLQAEGYAIKDMGSQKLKIVPNLFGISI